MYPNINLLLLKQMSSCKQSPKVKIKRSIHYWLTLSLSALPLTVTADEFDTIQFSTSINRAYDDNLFRVKNNQSSDQITTSTAGVKLDKTYSLQRFIVDVSYVDYKYQTNDFLDFEALNYDAKWLWSLTPSLTGSLTTSRNKTLNGFSDFRSFTQNIRTIDISQFRAEYSPYKVWALIGGLTETDVTNSQTFNAIAEYNSTAFDYGARYSFASGSNLSFLGHKRNGQFDRALNSFSLFDNGFSENEYELDFVLKATGKSNLSSKLAHLSRDYDNFTVRNYDVWIGYIKYDLLLTGKIRANLDLTRTASPFETNYSTYSVTDSANIGLSYLFSDKITFMLNGRLAQRDFRQGITPGLANRSDDEQSVSGSVTWRPIKNIGFTLSSIKSSRNASSAFNNFDYDDLTTSLMVDLKI
ncbi:XrtB/PEP-CTERM-associated polysaccharide biosynthesis outer membrane protein EpsL [Methylophilus sp. 14]|uniref:XrtB/PEP-CTERM-associated polysaccharide biosynthesis outer membrane protein EpsL n=1 Tax=Methylophilus sp. 14 TaxID=2781019 RepID=UPI001E41F6FE|nr:XrtB/PEP-CTERM-associated polysaccharide biosynthesis outer membrane protein EpsL [Methylophilus sp. 14]